MNRLLNATLVILAVILVLGPAQRGLAQYASQVVSYGAGTTPKPGYTVASSALGEPERFTGEGGFPSVVSPFNPPYLTNEIVSIGRGGELTLRLSHFALPQAAGPEIGVFANAGLIDFNYPDGLAGSPLGDHTFGIDSADVSVSEDGTTWVGLGNVTSDIPTNGYDDLTSAGSTTPGSDPSDFQQPFTGALSDFDGLPYYDAGGNGILDELAGSGGGTWLDISGTGLAMVGYIRFAVPEVGVTDNFELDAVSVSHAAMGPATVPEPGTLALGGLALVAVFMGWRAGRQKGAG